MTSGRGSDPRGPRSQHDPPLRAAVSTPLGAEPEICKYEQLRERPGPFYIEADWTDEAASAAAASDAAIPP